MANDEHLLGSTIQAAATGVAAAGIVLLLLTAAAELIRRRHRASRFVAMTDRLVPSSLHRVAIACLSILAGVGSLAGGRPAAASESIRDWLSTPTTTSVPAAPTPNTTTPSTTTPLDTPRDSPDPTPPETPTRPAGTHRAVTGATESVPPTPGPGDAPGNPQPDRQVSPPVPAASVPPPVPRPAVSVPVGPTATSASDRYTVVPGDCLWTIAAAHLPAKATNAEIDRAWRAIYATNREVIGENPSLIQPGQVLSLPIASPAP